MFRVFVVCVLALACACGDDDDGKDKGAGGSAAANGGSGGSVTGTGSSKEGAACKATATCSSGLKCVVAAALEDDTGASLGIQACARPCKEAATDCQSGESCRTLTGDPGDSFCRSVTTEAFKACGAGDTSTCAPPLTCFTLQEADGSLQGGICFQLCALPGATVSAPACPDGQMCANALGDTMVGACAATVKRGEVCEPDSGKFCETSDFCITEADSDISHCYQDCTKDGTCADGKTCMPLPDGDKFCE